MPLKTIIEQDGQKYALLDADSNPIYVVDGNDVGYDGEKIHKDLNVVNSESAGRRRELTDAKATIEEQTQKLTALEGIEEKFKGIDDPAAAIKALETVKNLDAKKLIDAGEVEKVKSEAIADAEKAINDKWQTKIDTEYKPVIAERDMLRDKLDVEILTNKFAQSKYIPEEMIVPTEMVQASFSKHFRVVDGAVKAYDSTNEEIPSRENPGRKADFDEALKILVESSPHGDRIIKGNPNKGGGAPGGGGGGVDADKFISPEKAQEMAIKNPKEFAKLMEQGYNVG